MSTVLLRVWPNPSRGDVVAHEKIVETDDVMAKNGDLFRIRELERDVVIETRPSDPPEGADFALHFLVNPREVLMLASRGWHPIPDVCPTCPRR